MRTAAIGLVVFLLAGCIADAPPTLQARNETREAGESPNYPGLSVRGTLDVDGDQLTIVAFARNEGNATYKVEAGCTSPWSAHLFRGEERFELQEPQAQCESFSLAQLPPGQSLTFSTGWGGTVWDEDERRQVRAPRGDYVWSVRFVAYQEDGAQIKRFDLDFNVTVA